VPPLSSNKVVELPSCQVVEKHRETTDGFTAETRRAQRKLETTGTHRWTQTNTDSTQKARNKRRITQKHT